MQRVRVQKKSEIKIYQQIRRHAERCLDAAAGLSDDVTDFAQSIAAKVPADLSSASSCTLQLTASNLHKKIEKEKSKKKTLKWPVDGGGGGGGDEDTLTE